MAILTSFFVNGSAFVASIPSKLYKGGSSYYAQGKFQTIYIEDVQRHIVFEIGQKLVEQDLSKNGQYWLSKCASYTHVLYQRTMNTVITLFFVVIDERTMTTAITNHYCLYIIQSGGPLSAELISLFLKIPRFDLQNENRTTRINFKIPRLLLHTWDNYEKNYELCT